MNKKGMITFGQVTKNPLAPDDIKPTLPLSALELDILQTQASDLTNFAALDLRVQVLFPSLLDKDGRVLDQVHMVKGLDQNLLCYTSNSCTTVQHARGA